MLKEFFPVDFFDKATINMTSRYATEDEENEDEEKQEKSSEDNDKTLIVLEASLASMDCRQIFNLPEGVR